MDVLNWDVLNWLGHIPTEYGRLGLFASAFLSATLLPGSSELALLAWIKTHPQDWLTALILASSGNTLGSLSSLWLGRRFRQGSLAPKLSPRVTSWLNQHGCKTLLLSWLPLIGDGLCLGAGWLGLSIWPSLLAIATGKTLRYLALIWPLLALN